MLAFVHEFDVNVFHTVEPVPDRSETPQPLIPTNRTGAPLGVVLHYHHLTA